MDSSIDTVWMNEVREWVWNYILPHVKGDAELKAQFVDKDRTIFWLYAFTHETADASVNNTVNMEKIEFTGDPISESHMKRFMIKKYPKMSVGELAEMATYYSNGKIQSQLLFSKADPSKIVRIGSGLSIKDYSIGSDIFEAIIGAITECGDSITDGLGDVMAKSLLFDFFYKDYPYDEDIKNGIPKNQVRKILTRYPSTKTVPIEKKETQVGGIAKITVYMSQPHIDIFTQSGLKPESVPKGGIIGYGEANNVDDASDIAYAMALKQLKALHLTVEWSDAKKAEIERGLPQIRPYANDFITKLLADGYRNYEINKSSKMSTKTRLVQVLRGVRADGTKKILLSVEGSLDKTESIAKLFELYIQGKTGHHKIQAKGR